MSLLVLEDRQVMADSIAGRLRREGLALDVGYDGRAALGLAAVLLERCAWAELIARMRPRGRRAIPARPPIPGAGDLLLDPKSRLAERAGQPLPLTNKELNVLEVLMSANGQVASAEEQPERVRDAHTDPFANTGRVTLANLRGQVGDPPVISTVIGAGYGLVR